MKDKIKWFGIYSNSKIHQSESSKEWNIVSINFKTHELVLIDDNNYDYLLDFSSYKCKLILKELKDIIDEDLKGLNGIDEYRFWEKEEFSNDMEFSLNHNEVDFLRSKGFAIGIPEEYYITESEMKEETNNG